MARGEKNPPTPCKFNCIWLIMDEYIELLTHERKHFYDDRKSYMKKIQEKIVNIKRVT